MANAVQVPPFAPSVSFNPLKVEQETPFGLTQQSNFTSDFVNVNQNEFVQLPNQSSFENELVNEIQINQPTALKFEQPKESFEKEETLPIK